MRTTIDLPSELLRAAKAQVAQDGETLKELFTRAVANELARPVAHRVSGRVEFPLISGRAGRDKSLISNAEIAEIFAAEDAEKYGA